MFPAVDRSTGIGGSEIAAICGVSPWQTPFDVFMRKTGQFNPPPDPRNEFRLLYGQWMEPVIKKSYEYLTGREIAWCGEPRRHQTRAWQVWSPDALCVDGSRGVEAKTANKFVAHEWGEPGTDEVPTHYALQCAWYMSASELPAWDLIVDIAGNPSIYTVTRDKEIEAVILEQAEQFWEKHILAGVAPAIGAGEGARRFLRERFPRNVKNLRQATAEEITLIRAYSWASKTLKIAEEDHETAGNMLKLAIGDADGLTFDGGTITWRKDKDSIGTDWYAVAWFLQEQDRARLAAAHQIVTRQGPRKLLLKENKQ